MNVTLIRHPKPLIPFGTCYGRLDIPLAPEGVAALPRLQAELSAIAGRPVWTSPARRCRALADLLSPSPIQDPRLLELDFGAWEGRLWDDVDRASIDRWAADPLAFAPPGGESGHALVARVRSFHATLLEHAQDCLVVAHGGPLKVLLALLRGETPDLLAAPMALGEVAAVQNGPAPRPAHTNPATFPVLSERNARHRSDRR